ncbi:hypothetical protein MLD38_031056 [Melastoma candidum]|uniref:Uncharacterized protein n=1 Tax=Melastoma candidum TaxID=119954 RepID=A0ACB9MMX3_9MYRT|nr:hypothetical protein MLD38_031056 [Melastoma candidum]
METDIKLQEDDDHHHHRNPPPPVTTSSDKIPDPDPTPNASAASPSIKKSVRWNPELISESPSSPPPPHLMTPDRHPQPPPPSSPAAAPSFNFQETFGAVKDTLWRWGKKAGEATRKAEDLAGNTWQHLKTSPSLAEAAMGRIAHGTKVLAEGGYDKIFHQTFEVAPDERLETSYVCYLSTSAGPVMGILYVSTAKVAFCSDNPLSYKSNGQTEWSYYKIVIPLHQLKAVVTSTSSSNTAEKYIQVVSVDDHEFWFMGFLNYFGAVQSLQNCLNSPTVQSV